MIIKYSLNSGDLINKNFIAACNISLQEPLEIITMLWVSSTNSRVLESQNDLRLFEAIVNIRNCQGSVLEAIYTEID